MANRMKNDKQNKSLNKISDKELKDLLKSAYMLPESEEEKAFIRKHEKRSLKFLSIIRIELQYLGMQSVLATFIMCVLFYIMARAKNEEMIWMLSALMPICALIPMILLSKSERYGMVELESASRFSLRFVRLVRMLIIGCFSISLLLGVNLILKFTLASLGLNEVICLIVPYLASNWGAMLITRKWHGKENIIGVVAVCLIGSLLPFGIRMLQNAGQLPDVLGVIMTVSLLMAVIRECVLYIAKADRADSFETDMNVLM